MKFKLILLSDGFPGSDSFLSGYIDRDIPFDRFGVPFIPAKRIKGLLKESAKNLHDYGELVTDIEQLFGKEGDAIDTFKISNGKIPQFNELHRFLNFTSDNTKLA